MKFLILSNGAPGYHNFFNGLARELVVDGHVVEIAVDCQFSRDSNRLDDLDLKIHSFSEVFSKAKVRNELLESYKAEALNAALISDFERAEIYKIGSRRDTEYYRRLQSALLEFFEDVLREGHFDFIIYENISNTFAHFAWIVAKRMDVQYLGLVGSRLPGRFTITSDPLNEHLNYYPIVTDILEGRRVVPEEVNNWCKNYLSNLDSIVPDYMKFNNLDNLKLLNRYLNVPKFKKLLLLWKHRNDDHLHAFQVGNPLALSWRMVWRNIMRKSKISSCRRYYTAPQRGDRYLLYPLHYHPESSTSILSNAYLDEFDVIRNICFSLPVGTMLYVKDHISAFGYPPINFYRKLASLPNVRILSPFENTKALIRNSAAVITLTSTVGYEALLLNKRVFLFGSTFYKFHPNVVRVENPARLFELFESYLDENLPADQEYNLQFLAGYYMGTYDGVLNFTLGACGAQKLVKQVLPQLKKVFLSRKPQVNNALQI